MADQLSSFALGCYGNPVVKTPHLDRLAERGVVFDAYCNSPLCAPSRFSMLAGRLPAGIQAYDNAAYFSTATPTLAHYLRRQGYQTCLSGKMHFVGPDQLHGFEQRLTTDIYPADFGWTPDWTEPERRIDWWYHNLSSVKQAGVAEITNQLEFDDETGFQARQKLYDLARRQDSDPRPFMLLVSFTHPHDPYVTRRRYWELYDESVDMPRIGPVDYDRLDPHSQRLYRVSDSDRFEIDENDVRNARRAYYGNVSYIDEQCGALLDILTTTGLADNTVVIFTSDHGDMLGERGLWYKMSFFEPASRVPLIIAAPPALGLSAGRVDRPVSLVDLLPTLTDIAGSDRPADTGAEPVEPVTPLDGHSLLSLARGGRDWPHDVAGEYFGEGCIAPLLMLRRGRYKYVYCQTDPEQLYDLADDPDERNNLAGDARHGAVLTALRETAAARWDSDALSRQVIADQRQRRLLHQSLSQGRHTPWDYQPATDASRRFMRNHLDLNELEHNARWPRAVGPRAAGDSDRD